MRFEPQEERSNVLCAIGYLLSYSLFSTILFLAMFFLGKLHEGFGVFHILGITASIALVAACTRWALK